MAKHNRAEARTARHVRLRKRLSGTSERPRLAIFRSIKHIYAQIIDDTTGRTLVAASSEEKGVEGGGKVDGAKAVGALIAERAKEKGIGSVVFDRGGFRYHGRIASLAEGARDAGLEF